ncbi:T9SS type A sorting domain-containing protein [Candidatus Poribacteria bacterium]|nr:T9SS type A sorting domain-containing protein [Candidatus Poribacteria bacterium]
MPATFHAISDTEAPPIIADVNNDGVVNVLDLILIASNFGQSRQNDADVNRDGVVSILDLVLAAGMFEEEAAAPSAQSQVPEIPTAVEVQGWLTDARALQVRYPLMKRGVLVLEQLLVFLTPRETELLANFPNPFNPETWIPYRLAEDAFVTLTIYDLSGQVVCTLDVGHRIASAYESRSRAIYWAGKNGLGKPVASGVYFYTLTAGGFSATRRMLILK